MQTAACNCAGEWIAMVRASGASSTTNPAPGWVTEVQVVFHRSVLSGGGRDWNRPVNQGISALRIRFADCSLSMASLAHSVWNGQMAEMRSQPVKRCEGA